MNTPNAAPLSPAPIGALTGRLESLDAYRGLIMFTLLCGGIFHSLKGHPVWNWLYVQNEHVAWAGCVYWDLIQPSFMFMVGVAMPFAFQRRLQLGAKQLQLLQHAGIRAFNLLAIGILLDHIGSDKIQIGFIRVLQQIAIGYVIAVLGVGRSLRTQGLLAAGILIGYQLLWMFNPWNGMGGPWAIGNENIGSAFDRWMLGRNYSGHYVGLNAIPSAATIVLGVMAGTRILTASSPRQVCNSLLLGAIGGIGFGLAVSPWFPLIKRIWTPSFAIYAAGWTTLFLLGFYWLIEVKQYRRWAFPLTVVGMNSIAAYVLGNAFGGWFRSATTAWIVWLKPILGDVVFPIFQRGLFAAAAWGVLYWLWKRKIFFKA